MIFMRKNQERKVNVTDLLKLSKDYLSHMPPEKAFDMMRQRLNGSGGIKGALKEVISACLPFKEEQPFLIIASAGMERSGGYYSTHHTWKNRIPVYDRRFLDVRLFSEGLAVAEDETGFFHIRPDGTPAYKARYKQTHPFVNKFARIVDKTPISRPRNHETALLRDILQECESGEQCHIVHSGMPAYLQRYLRVGDFFEGLASATNNRGCLHITSEGEPAYEQIYGHVGRFSEGLANVLDKDECFHIKKDGSPAYPHRYKVTGAFSEGYAEAKDDEGWLHIKPNGTPAYEKRFGVIHPFSEGVAVVREDGEGWFHIKPDGTPLYKERYSETFDFRDGVAGVHTPEMCYTLRPSHIDKTGKVIGG
jgi:hypothetical protein